MTSYALWKTLHLLGVVLPIQIEQARLARRWIFRGLVATAPLCVAMWLMVAKVP